MGIPLTDKESQAFIWSLGLTPMLVGAMTLIAVWVLTFVL